TSKADEHLAPPIHPHRSCQSSPEVNVGLIMVRNAITTTRFCMASNKNTLVKFFFHCMDDVLPERSEL
ncbi:MAG TPA: hypothetical protein PLZ21_00165, partial [Armatimonadota bacterium]|nr:hypothetical protein [Armatimonadota bacterium]